MALVGTVWVMAALALASSIYWAAALAPADSAAGVWPFIVAFVGAAAVAAATSYAVARQRGRTSLAPLVFAALAAFSIADGGLLVGAVWPLAGLAALALCAYSLEGWHRLRSFQQPEDPRNSRAI